MTTQEIRDQLLSIVADAEAVGYHRTVDAIRALAVALAAPPAPPIDPPHPGPE